MYKCDNTKLMMIQNLIFTTAKPIPFGGHKVFYEVTGGELHPGSWPSPPLDPALPRTHSVYH